VPLGIHRYARDFTQIQAGREFQKIRNRLISDVGRLLSVER
jgi:hypothetical protein